MMKTLNLKSETSREHQNKKIYRYFAKGTLQVTRKNFCKIEKIKTLNRRHILECLQKQFQNTEQIELRIEKSIHKKVANCMSNEKIMTIGLQLN